jgi:D-ribose pyranase
MKKIGILNDRLSKVIASMGHMDFLTVCDAGLPIPEGVNRIDLSVVPGIPTFLNVLEAVKTELEVQKIYLAEEIKEKNPAIEQEILELFPNLVVVYIPHEEFKHKSQKSRAIIRTGECSPYANIILESGVTF